MQQACETVFFPIIVDGLELFQQKLKRQCVSVPAYSKDSVVCNGVFIDQVLTGGPGAQQVLPCPPAPRQLCSAGTMQAAAFLYRWGKVPTTIRSMNDYPRERFPATEKEAEFTSMVDLASEHCKVLSNLKGLFGLILVCCIFDQDGFRLRQQFKSF